MEVESELTLLENQHPSRMRQSAVKQLDPAASTAATCQSADNYCDPSTLSDYSPMNWYGSRKW